RAPRGHRAPRGQAWFLVSPRLRRSGCWDQTRGVLRGAFQIRVGLRGVRRGSWFLRGFAAVAAGTRRGAFFEERFKSVANLDEEAFLAACAYVDLNAVAAGIAAVPESSAHTSIKARVDHVNDQGRTDHLKPARVGNVAGSAAAAGLEEGLWLCPIEDR